MKTTRLLSILSGILAMILPETAAAYDFSVEGIYYNVLSEADGTVEVTFEKDPDPFSEPAYKGDIEIPAYVVYNDKTYTVTAVGEQAFYGCDWLTGVKLPDTIKKIGRIAFSMDLELKNVNLPEGLETICNSAFFFCTKITEYNIPASVIMIEDNVFFENQALEKIEVAAENTDYTSYDGILYDKGLTSLMWCPAKKTSAILAPTTLEILPSAFSSCKSIESITLNENLKTIGKSAFTGCINLRDIYIPETVESIGQYVFVGCTALAEINVGAGNKNYSSVSGILYNKDRSELLRCPCMKTAVEICPTVEKIGEMAFTDCINLKEITFPPSVRAVSDYAFNVTGIEKLNLNEGLESIGESGFGSNNNLTSLHIPSSVKSIGNSAFSGCAALAQVSGGEGLTRISEHMFSLCPALTVFTVPANVTAIDNYAFYECTSLKNINLHKNISTLGNSVFFRCTALENIELPELKKLESSLFYQCESLTNIVLPNSIEEIGTQVFANSGLEKVTIGKNVVSIDNRAFYTTTLTEVNILAENPPAITNSTFSSSIYPKATLTVPQGTLEAYENDPIWSKFITINENQGSGLNLNSMSGPAEQNLTVDVYSLSGNLIRLGMPASALDSLAPGIYLIHTEAGTRKIRIR